CDDTDIIRLSTPYIRHVRHLPAFDKKTFLCVPAIRMSCKACRMTFVWQYESVEPKKRYTKAFGSQLPKHIMGSTVHHAADILSIPYTTAERMYKNWMDEDTPRVQQECLAEAKERKQLVLGIDDFAIRKGHTYNTGLHDLKGGTFLDIIPGRTLEELRDYYRK